MLAGHKLALALGVVDSTAVTGDDELSRKQLIRAGEEMVKAGLAIVVNKAGTKQPICTLTAREKKVADQEAVDTAAAKGDPNAHKRTHRCGLVHAITDLETATRVLTRMTRRERFNIGIEPRASRVLIVDVDTAKQAAEFAMRCGSDRPELTVRSPGQRDKDGNWVHRNGGHIWFDVPDGVELPSTVGSYTDDAGWSAIWGEHQVLVPPSVREEGPYVLSGSAHPLPQWLLDLITTEAIAAQFRREEAARRRKDSGPTAIDDWSTRTPWADLLLPDGWTETGLVDNCGCPIWTAPGEHASPKSATAHEPGCGKYVLERGHGPLHVWTDHPSQAVADAIAAFGSRTLTKAQMVTYTEGAGQMGRTLDELGIERADGPTTLRTSFSTWSQVGEPVVTGTVDEDPDEDDEADDLDEDSEDESPRETAGEYEERNIRREYDRLRWQRLAQERIEAESAPPMTVHAPSQFFDAPRPRPLIPPRS